MWDFSTQMPFAVSDELYLRQKHQRMGPKRKIRKHTKLIKSDNNRIIKGKVKKDTSNP